MFLSKFVEQIAGKERAPKITGMLIEMPIHEIRSFLVDYGRLIFKVQETNDLLL